MGRAHLHFSGLTPGQFIARGIGYAHLGVEKGFAGRADPVPCIIRSDQAGRATGFGHAVDLVDLYAEFQVAVDSVDRQRRGAAGDGA